ncbi:precorrin-6Y C5,15-methyltransferase (decarboxylating) [Haloactinospora alba]|uniref:Precorrin-6Y C5,15-methyltransferase (Decarboxylating) n=1 Tax=Haloactinospora alba TaxID=405555 RepID=A0A543NKR6_9ACTN|nr:precorrin-6y C5,15-methyltransferase (decarboxylating) subunit CbiE [Haloactinospora alba]TQN32411.1 precorrin-6Y C5,15-methyltransferase (decarboxylating) [Haloactinospora alba]
MITVIGIDGGPLPEEAAAALAEASCVVGARRHLDAVPVPDRARPVPLTSLVPALEEARAAVGSAVILASGDPGFFGIVRALREQGDQPRVVPAVSSVATAFARIGLAWDDAVVASAHGRGGGDRSAGRALAAALAHPKAAVLTAPGTAEPAEFLPALLDAGRDVYVAQRLGSADEEVTRVTPESAERDWPHPNVVLAVDPRHAVASAPPWTPGHRLAPDGWALEDAEFEHRDSMITKPEVRACALAHLAPRPGTTVWDVGAGSGSVAVECARFGAHAVAFERNPQDCERIRRNAAAFDVYVTVREGAVPGTADAQRGHPPPDALFLGGGDDAAAAATVRRWRPHRVVAALASVDRVGTMYHLLTETGYETSGTQLQASRLSPLPNGSLRFDAANPVTLLWGVLPEAGGTQ